ncbi:MAG: hypothetical protein IJW71_01120 [Clostridia bacterium]|nr:hypothetical protein [Clostridia bacterium]
MRRTKKLTLSAILSALGVLLLALGTLSAVLDLTAIALAALLVLFAAIEMRTPYQLLVAAATATLALLLLPDKSVALLYLLFGGAYPILKELAERLPRRLAWVVKIAVYNLLFFAAGALLFWLFGLDLSQYSLGGRLPNAAVVALGVLFFEGLLLLYDLALTRVRLWYFCRLRNKILPILK